MTIASESASSNLQTSQSGCLAFARWPQSNRPYAGSGTAARRGGGAETLRRATTEAVAGAAAILVGS